MTGLEKYEVRLFRSLTIELALPAKDMLSINRVAAMLSISTRTLRRMIKEGTFPRSHIRKGLTAYWQRQFVRRWKRERLRVSAARGEQRGQYRDLDAIDRAEEKEFGRKPIDIHGAERRRTEMESLLKTDPVEFARQHPALRQWVKDNGLL